MWKGQMTPIGLVDSCVNYGGEYNAIKSWIVRKITEIECYAKEYYIICQIMLHTDFHTDAPWRLC